MKNRLYVICACLITMIYFVLTPFSISANTIEKSSGGDVVLRWVGYNVIDAIEDVDNHITYYSINDVITSATDVGNSFKITSHKAADLYCSDPCFTQVYSITIPSLSGGSSSYNVTFSGMYSQFHGNPEITTIGANGWSNLNLNITTGQVSLENPIVTEEVVALDSDQLTALMTRLNELFDNTEVSSTGVSQADELHNLRLWMINTYLPAIQQEYADVIANEVTIQNKIDTLNATIVQWLSTIDTNITDFKNNIDNLIDTISWNDINSTFSWGSDLSNLDNPSTISSANNKYIVINSTFNLNGCLYKIVLPFVLNTTRNIDLNISVAYFASNDLSGNYQLVENCYYLIKRNELYIYNLQSVNNRPVLIIINDNTVGLRFNNNGYVKYISSNDIEYWKLLDSITLQNLFNQFMQDYSNDSQELNDQSAAASSLITQEEQYHTSFNNSFQSDYNLIQNNFDFFNVTGDLLAAANWMSSFVNSMYINSGSFQVIMMIPLILGIIMWLIGRGSALFREPYQRPEYVPDRTDRVYNKNTGEVTRTTYYTRK